MPGTKNRITLIAGSAVAGILLAACGGGEAGDGEGATGDGSLTMWMLTNEPTQAEAMEAVTQGFEEEHGVTVSIQERSTDAHKEALRRVAGTGAGPDIYQYWTGPGLGGELVDAGMSRDLSDMYEEYGWNDRFTDAALDGVTQYGGYHGVPWVVQGQGIFYNKELFEQAGISDLPQTYEELVAAAESLQQAGITPMTFGGTVNWHVMRLLDNLIETFCGPEIADRLNVEQQGWDSEECVTEAFSELAMWGQEHLNEGFMGIANTDAAQLFFRGEAAMTIEGMWFNAQVPDNGMDPENVGIFLFPTGTDRIYGFSEAFYISEESDNAELAGQFLDYATSAEAQENVIGAWAPLSVNPEVEPDLSENPLHEPWLEFFEQADGMYINNDQNFSLEQTTEYWRIQNSVLTGEIAPDEAGERFQQFLDSNA